MMIKRKLKIIFYLCATLVAISSIAVIYSLRHMERKHEERKDIHAVTRGIFDLNILTDEYLLYHEKRPLEQWNLKYNAIARLIGIGSREPTHRVYLASLKDDYKDAKNLFHQLISAHNGPRFQDNFELSRRLENRLQSQVLIKNQELVTRADRMERRAHRELLIWQKRNGWLVLGLIAAVCVSVMWLTLLVRRSVVRPLEDLIKAADSIGKGNLDIRIDTEAHDEIGELSRAFDQMASRLNKAMLSQASLQNEVRHLDRVATMGTLSAAITHEINQPLAAILSNAQAALRFLNNEQLDLGQVEEALHDIVSDDKRAGEVIRRLRIILKKEELKSEPLEINDVIKEIISMINSEIIIKKASIVTDFKVSIPPVYGNRVQIQQVILNLLLNALDAMSNQPEESRQIRISTRTGEADTILVNVSDSGPGIDDLKLEAIFDTFYTTKTTGMGMGLSISRSIIEKHNGRIWVSNNPEGGATFTFTLPIAKHDAL